MSDLFGTNIIAPIVPFSSNDGFPTHLAQYGKGGSRTVQTISERNNISKDRLEIGMQVFVIETSKRYMLSSLTDTITNLNWKEDGSTTSSGVQSLISISENTILTLDSSVILASGNIIITLPSSVGAKGKVFTFKKIDTGTQVTILAYTSQTIDGVSNIVIKSKNESLTIISDDLNWLIL